MGVPQRFTVLADTTERLDRFLADQLQYSRTQAARLVADGRVSVNGTPARASRLLARGDAVEVTLPDAEPPRQLVPADIPLTIVHEDEHLAVIDKPAGLVVHPAPGHWDDTLVNALVARGTTLAGGAEGRPGIVHRLDRDTSGLMLIAKTDLAHRRLGHMLAARRIRRVYAALAWGHLDASPTRIEAPLGRHPSDRKRVAVLSTGRAAVTDAWCVARFAVADLLRLELQTGRTHQIRVHLAHIGHPVVGDPVYGAGGSRRISGPARLTAGSVERLAPRQALHAAQLALRHPVTEEPLEFRSEWPADLRPALELAAGDALSVAQPAPFAIFFSSIEMADSQAVRVVVFQVGDLACGIPAGRAREILAPLPTTRIPGAPEVVLGLVNVRGTLLTVVDGHRLLGRPPLPEHEGALLVLDVGTRRLGLAVGRVDDLFELPQAQLEAGEALPGVDRRLVKAVGRRDGHHFVLLDTEALLAPLLSVGGGAGRSPSRTT